MTKLKLLSAALIAAAMVATPAMARESHVSSRHLAENINTSTTPGARYLREGDGFSRAREPRFVGPLGHLLWAHDSVSSIV